jgi:hypothetical protein
MKFLPEFFTILSVRNAVLYRFGLLCLVAAIVTAVLIALTETKVLGINAWIKPTKFFVSTAVFVWTMAWLATYLEQYTSVRAYSWMVVIVFTIELSYIAGKAAVGELSHFNVSTSFNNVMWSVMGLLIVFMTLWTAYLGGLFFVHRFPDLPPSFVWGIRLGILLFVVFAFEGSLMARQLAHSVGGADGGAGLPVTNWSTQHGDLRVAHFFGLHALQILPLASFYLLKRVDLVCAFAVLYFALVSFTFWQAKQGQPLLGPHAVEQSTQQPADVQ